LERKKNRKVEGKILIKNSLVVDGWGLFGRAKAHGVGGTVGETEGVTNR